MSSDTRQHALEQWLHRCDCPATGPLTIASADASARRYFRVPTRDGPRIAMDAPPEREETRAFVDVAHRLARAGVHVPTMEAHDPEHGFVLMSDFGDTNYLDRLSAEDARALIDAAIDTLVRMQACARTAGLGTYDTERLGAELDLFPQWYVRTHVGYEPDPAWWRLWHDVRATLIERALAQPRVFVHRDYMARNLMVTTPYPGVLDFQDALAGPITYDLASLLRDAFASWNSADEQRWIARYRAAARSAGLPVGDDARAFDADLAHMGAQRHLKVLGIFARLCHRDGKPHYIADAPRFRGYLAAEASAAASLQPIQRLLQPLTAEAPS
jgi:aminoglycoside/choline kinase family phosphotransferase